MYYEFQSAWTDERLGNLYRWISALTPLRKGSMGVDTSSEDWVVLAVYRNPFAAHNDGIWAT